MSEAIKIAVLGAGSWGTALASLTARHAYPTLIWGRNVEQIKAINEQHENTRYLPGIPYLKACTRVATCRRLWHGLT